MAQKIGTVRGVLDNAYANRTSSPQIKEMISINKGESASRTNFKEIPVDEITPRPVNNYTQSRIDNLAKSIHHTEDSLINPIVIARATDLPENSEVIIEFKRNGIDIGSLKYVIVDGERRFRAWSLLRENKKKELKGRQGEINPFDKITARVLTAIEARKEKIFHEEANLFARRLTNTEIVLNVKDAIENIETNTDKRNALIEMNHGNEEGINEDPDVAAKKYRAERYCQFYLESELGITDIGESTIRKKLAIIHGCIPEIVEDHITGVISENMALRVIKADKNLQKEIYSKYGAANSEFVKEIERTINNQEKEVRYYVKDQKSKIIAIGKSLSKYKEDLIKIKEWLGKKDEERAEKYIKELEEFENATKQYIGEL